MKRLSIIIALCTILCVSQFGMADLIGHWKLEAGSGDTAVSAINSPDEDGTIVGGAAWDTTDIPAVPSGSSAMLVLDGSSGTGINTPVAGIAGAGARTIAAWVKVDDGNYGGSIVSYGDHSATGLGTRFTFKINNDSGVLRCEIAGGFSIGTTSVTDGQWHHVAIVVPEGETSTSNVKFYVDGVEDAVADFGDANPINSDPANMSVGYSKAFYDLGWAGAMELIGSIDEVRVYDNALAANEVAALYSEDYAKVVSPANGATLVALDAAVSWEAPGNYVPDGYNVYFGTDPNLGTADRKLTGTTATSYDPFGTGDMAFETTYYWRVDAIEPGTGTIYQGPVWSFETIPARPVITGQPVDVMVGEGDSFTLSVTATNPLTGDMSNLEYQWQLDGAAITGATSADYTVASASAADEGTYTCVVAISGNGSTTSDAAAVGVKRMLAKWTLDQADYANGQYLDVVNGYNADPNGTPVFTAGWDGSATGAITPNQDAWATASTWNPAEFTGQYGISAWIKWDGTGPATYGSGIVAKGTAYGADTDFFFLVLRGTEDGNAGLWLYNYSSFLSTNGVVVPNEWTHVAAGFDGSQYRIYVNGELIGTAGGALDNGVDTPVVIGAKTSAGGDPFPGQIDEVAIYNYGLTDVEAAVLYANYTGESTCLTQPAMDITGPDGEPDCVVNLYDFAEFAASWMECGLVPECQ
ncbi:hypothetical protein STSP2_02142 [Anaerohalosphaera lusitana]|uniref:Ig-like domain-containing protein n=1 Tax=Anaerohalosphaera lusitana TaxID=1936003 RepID=A0A1U9NMA7_9BACT|nr:LamG-like jellyroll fold domain-containing protein [Anaerohalosphaera lusitana]AQT68965.1 hypothetical protein STSP2_02142 [Anaerohalosphaera lusitana]